MICKNILSTMIFLEMSQPQYPKNVFAWMFIVKTLPKLTLIILPNILFPLIFFLNKLELPLFDRQSSVVKGIRELTIIVRWLMLIFEIVNMRKSVHHCWVARGFQKITYFVLVGQTNNSSSRILSKDSHRLSCMVHMSVPIEGINEPLFYGMLNSVYVFSFFLVGLN